MIKDEFEHLVGTDISDEMYYCMIEPMYEAGRTGKFAFAAMFDAESLKKMDDYLMQHSNKNWTECLKDGCGQCANIVYDLNQTKASLFRRGEMGCTNLNVVKHAQAAPEYAAQPDSCAEAAY